ncbi:hypothetical protein Rin_00012620 [Candidatus Regiella insecticola 5.15]|uniref:Uncharacterized protein n=1 Tax=Candidatus Regiella insecticola 5.15 TaxID=1005043 RepID=G2GZN8_9ENTR|nr:hypothetical protein Rin_00012620 [Candidatus Regiella insecticola 5.15]
MLGLHNLSVPLFFAAYLNEINPPYYLTVECFPRIKQRFSKSLVLADTLSKMSLKCSFALFIKYKKELRFFAHFFSIERSSKKISNRLLVSMINLFSIPQVC